MTALNQDNLEEEFLWTCTLSGTTKEYTWAPDDLTEDITKNDKKDRSVKPNHKLLIKSAVLMSSAKADEVTIVQIESKG